jgi:hypothetical protein
MDEPSCIISPLTGRAIKYRGKAHKQLIKSGDLPPIPRKKPTQAVVKDNKRKPKKVRFENIELTDLDKKIADMINKKGSGIKPTDILTKQEIKRVIRNVAQDILRGAGCATCKNGKRKK